VTQRKKHNSSRVNLIISAVFHTALISVVIFFAAHEGLLGKDLKKLAVHLVAKEKKPEPPKEKPPEPKTDAPKPMEEARPASAPAPKVQMAEAPPPTAPSVAPPPMSLSGIDMGEFNRPVASGDPTSVYKGLVERTFTSHWNRPSDLEDEKFVAEVELSVDSTGQVGPYRWLKGSGNERWDGTVKAALASVHTISHPPPKGFPDKFMVRFDVLAVQTEEVIRLSSR